jgi:thioredoxin-related protein
LILTLLIGSQLLLHVTPSFSFTHVALEPATNLQHDGSLATQQAVPILLLVSRDHCAYCRLLKREILEPIRLRGKYLDQVIMREVLIDPGQSITNFQGQYLSTRKFASGYGVQLTPTVLFLDHEGRELTARIVGINTLEMYSFYLEAAIKEANQKLLDRLDKDGNRH